MNFGYHEDCLEHQTGYRHPESPDRLRAIRRALSRQHGVKYVAADHAPESAVTAVHDAGYVDAIKDFCADGGGDWDDDTVAVEATWDAALAAAGQAMWAAERALAGDDGRDTPFALGRPPGHHAVEDDAMGFCFVNNAAVAAQAVIDDGDADRVAILDWDVHHGNGIHDIFYDADDVFYCSIHEDGLYPGSGDVDETGEGDGEGTTMNVPLLPGCGDPDYCAAIDDFVGPEFVTFDPDLILVSAGFDAHRHDPISRMRVSTEGYGALTTRMRDVAEAADAGLGFVLEGGYGLDTLAESVTMVHEVFDGREPVEPEDEVKDRAKSIFADLRDQGFGEK
ncbi:histone deacetylase [Halorientalis sp. IM1011]|uniref:histone deacetylase family protein n=1 Tax=Halorientalis sp. IM1011 TaxID=1932360 RepID=UPI00097CD06E|nr:histone deacetylase [Halorientalis sp. IM1011]AQL42474.1 histone deacetylase [Halorientalis sp. IM1011]